jgi:hypothetical protein
MSISMLGNEQKLTELQSISVARIFSREVARITEELRRSMPFIVVFKAWSGNILILDSSYHNLVCIQHFDLLSFSNFSMSRLQKPGK